MTPPNAKQSVLKNNLHRFKPRLLQCLQGYTQQRFFKDLGAGLTVGLVALPLAMAFAIASGLQPQAGLVTAIVAGLIISAFGGSNVQIGGPAGAFIVVVLGIVKTHGLANLLISTMMAGGLLILMGWLGLGSLVRLIPVSIVIGFTNGIAVLIALSQVKDFLGLKHAWSWSHSWFEINPNAMLMALLCFVFLLVWNKQQASTNKHNTHLALLLRVPASIIVLTLSTTIAWAFDLQLSTIGSQFGNIPNNMPAPSLPSFNGLELQTLIAPSLTIAFLCAVESLLCARVADGLTRDKHDPNQELMAQGLANIASPLFGGMPATGTIARTITNIRSGANTPMAGMIHALMVLFVMLIAAPLASHIPLAALSAILMFVAYNMGEWKEFRRLKQYSMMYRTILLSTFALTILIDLTVAIEVGLILAALFFIYRISTLTEFIPIDLKENEYNKGIQAYSIYGSLFFAVVGKIERLQLQQTSRTSVLILDLHQTISIDTTALEALENLNQDLEQAGKLLIFCGLNQQAKSLFHRSGFSKTLKPKQLQLTFSEAMQQASLYCENPKE